MVLRSKVIDYAKSILKFTLQDLITSYDTIVWSFNKDK